MEHALSESPEFPPAVPLPKTRLSKLAVRNFEADYRLSQEALSDPLQVGAITVSLFLSHDFLSLRLLHCLVNAFLYFCLPR